MICWKCKKEINIEQIFRSSECPLCGADLHCCKQCKFFSAGSHYECKENIDSLVSDKEKSNFCDFFSVKSEDFSNDITDKASEAKAAAAALFGDSSINEKPKKSNLDAFNSLFS